jgi:hypothetical protein
VHSLVPGWQGTQAEPTQAIVLHVLGVPQEPAVEQVTSWVVFSHIVLLGMQSTQWSLAQARFGQRAAIPQVPESVHVENRVGSPAAHCVSPG